MDNKETKQIIINNVQLERLIDDIINVENPEENRRILEYFKSKGCDIEKYKKRQKDKEDLISSINYN